MEKKLPLYFISGLAADDRAFLKMLELPSFQKYDIHQIKWISPIKNESIDNYVERLIQPYALPSNYVLIGLSFGGVVAQHIAKKHPPLQLILLSTIHQSIQKTLIIRSQQWIPMYKLIPEKLFKTKNPITRSIMGLRKRNKIFIETFWNMIETSPKGHIKWGIQQVVNFQPILPTSITPVVIHGTNDLIFNVPTTPYHAVEGSHFIVYTQYKKVGKIIEDSIQKVL